MFTRVRLGTPPPPPETYTSKNKAAQRLERKKNRSVRDDSNWTYVDSEFCDGRPQKELLIHFKSQRRLPHRESSLVWYESVGDPVGHRRGQEDTYQVHPGTYPRDPYGLQHESHLHRMVVKVTLLVSNVFLPSLDTLLDTQGNIPTNWFEVYLFFLFGPVIQESRGLEQRIFPQRWRLSSTSSWQVSDWPRGGSTHQEETSHPHTDWCVLTADNDSPDTVDYQIHVQNSTIVFDDFSHFFVNTVAHVVSRHKGLYRVSLLFLWQHSGTVLIILCLKSHSFVLFKNAMMSFFCDPLRTHIFSVSRVTPPVYPILTKSKKPYTFTTRCTRHLGDNGYKGYYYISHSFPESWLQSGFCIRILQPVRVMTPTLKDIWLHLRVLGKHSCLKTTSGESRCGLENNLWRAPLWPPPVHASARHIMSTEVLIKSGATNFLSEPYTTQDHKAMSTIKKIIATIQHDFLWDNTYAQELKLTQDCKTTNPHMYSSRWYYNIR